MPSGGKEDEDIFNNGANLIILDPTTLERASLGRENAQRVKAPYTHSRTADRPTPRKVTSLEYFVMPETERKLVLHSPASSEHVEYRWPLSRTVRIFSVWKGVVPGHKNFCRVVPVVGELDKLWIKLSLTHPPFFVTLASSYTWWNIRKSESIRVAFGCVYAQIRCLLRRVLCAYEGNIVLFAFKCSWC